MQTRQRWSANELMLIGEGCMGGGAIGIILFVVLLLLNQKFGYWALILIPSVLMLGAGVILYIIGRIKKWRRKMPTPNSRHY